MDIDVGGGSGSSDIVRASMLREVKEIMSSLPESRLVFQLLVGLLEDLVPVHLKIFHFVVQWIRLLLH